MFNAESSGTTATGVTHMPMLGIVDQKNTMAFAKLEGSGVQHYMQNLEITIGRKYHNEKHADFPLTFDDSISKFHALLFYNFYSRRYELMVTGRNNAYVNRKLVTIGSTVPLESKCLIQIGDVEMKFTLPDSAEIREQKQESKSIRESTQESRLTRAVRETTHEPKLTRAVRETTQDSNMIKEETPVLFSNGMDSPIPHDDGNTSHDEFFDAEENDDSSDSVDDNDEDEDDGDYDDGNDADFENERSDSESQQGEEDDDPQAENTFKIINSYKQKIDKPPFPLFVIIANAIRESTDKCMTAKEMFEYIIDNYPYFKTYGEERLMKSIYQSMYVKSVKFVCYQRLYTKVYKLKTERGLARALRTYIDSPPATRESQTPSGDPYKMIGAYKSRDGKPPFTIYALVAFVFHQSKHTSMTSGEITRRVITCFPYWASIKLSHVKDDVTRAMRREPSVFVCHKSVNTLERWTFHPNQAFEDKIVKQIATSAERPVAANNSLERRKEEFEEAFRIIDEYTSIEGEPPFPLHVMAAYAFHKSNSKLMTAKEILSVLMEHFPYYEKDNYSRLYDAVKKSMSASSKFLNRPMQGQNVRGWYMNPDKDYDIKSYVDKSVRGANNLKNHASNVNVSYNIDPDHYLDDYLYQPEEPPFSLYILAAHALATTGKTEISMQDILLHLEEYFPFYKTQSLKSMRSRMRSSLSQRRSSPFICIPSHPKFLYAFDKTVDFEKQIQSGIKECINRISRVKRLISEEDEGDTSPKRRKIKEEEDDDDESLLYRLQEEEE